MRDIQPEAPHLSISVYSETRHESEVLRSAYEVARYFGTADADYIVVVPAGLRFEAVGDLADVLEKKASIRAICWMSVHVPRLCVLW
jgi:hypothetical protein